MKNRKPLDMTINLDRLRSVRLKLRRGLVKLTMCSAVGLDERYKTIENKSQRTGKQQETARSTHQPQAKVASGWLTTN